MTILLVSLLNVIFILMVYFIFSSKIKKISQSGKSEGLSEEVNVLIQEFNSVADMNISQLDDRLESVKKQTGKAERTIQEIEGLINRYQLLRDDDIKNVKKQSKSKTKKKEVAKPLKKKQGEEGKKVGLKKNLSAYDEVTSAHPFSEKNSVKNESGSFEDLVEKGFSANEISDKLGVSRGEVDLKLRILKFKKP